jgi:hypothetical protein
MALSLLRIHVIVLIPMVLSYYRIHVAFRFMFGSFDLR